MITIYQLRDPRDGSVRYVGRTSRPLGDRLANHLWPASGDRSGRAQWIRDLRRAELEPAIEALEVCEDAIAPQRERAWISEIVARGASLNVGGSSGRPPTLGGADRRIAARLDPASAAALDVLTADGTSETDAIRSALIAAAKRKRLR